MRFGIKEQIIMMEHENERMSYSFEPSDESSGAQGYHQTSYDPNYNQNEHKNPKKKNGVGGRMVALLVAVALVASIGGSALTTVINNISRKNEEANAKAQETMSAQTVEPAQDDSQDTATENSSYSLEKSALPKSLSSNDTGKSLTPKEVYAMNVNATVGIATQITTNVWGQVASASASGSGFILTSDGYVVTNNHVVEGATSVTVKLYNGDEYDAEVIGTDENYPIAICDDAIVKAINPSFVKLPLEMGTVKKFDTLEQLADAFGIPKQALLDEVAKFNGYVKANDDKDFHRILTFNKGLDVSKAPFYGIEVSPKIHHTMGGVMINENAEVISANTHKPIPGLYAGGEVAGGVHGASRLGTVAVIDALTFGMIAGENFAKMQ